jgi:hypothetical protein
MDLKELKSWIGSLDLGLSYRYVDYQCAVQALDYFMSQLEVTSHKSFQNMPRSEIPVDVLRDILGHVDIAGLAAMCRVNKICCSCSQDVLYRDIYVRDDTWVIRTLASSTHLARRVRSFNSYYIDPDLVMALQNMTSLRILKLPTGEYMDLLDGCTFKLDTFGCYYADNPNGSLPKFLSSQPSLKCVILPQDFGSTPPSSLEATCLPNLTRIDVTFPWLPYLIPGRPLNEVITTGCTYDEHSIDLSFFTLSITPIQKLTIDYSYLYPTPVHLLASFLPSLTHFTLTVLCRYTVFKDEGVCGLPLCLLLDIEQHGIVWT